MLQLDIFGEPDAPKTKITRESLKLAPIASRDEVLKIQTAIMFNERVKPSDRIKSSELICKMQGYFMQKSPELDEPATPVQIIFTTHDARVKSSTD